MMRDLLWDRIGSISDDHDASDATITIEGVAASRPTAILYVVRTGEAMVIERALGPTIVIEGDRGPTDFVVKRGALGTTASALAATDPVWLVGYIDSVANSVAEGGRNA